MSELQFGALSDGCPWRDVVHIEDYAGRRGAKWWRLTLDCGHRTSRKQPLSGAADGTRLGHALGTGGGAWLKKITAPQRVKCLLCGNKEQP